MNKKLTKQETRAALIRNIEDSFKERGGSLGGYIDFYAKFNRDTNYAVDLWTADINWYRSLCEDWKFTPKY